MENTPKKNKASNSEILPFNISNFSSLQYIKIIFLDSGNELYEVQADSYKIDKNITQLYVNNKKIYNIECPIGAVLKLVMADSIHFAKTILNNVRNIDNRLIFILDTPTKTIQQQNRKYYRINKERPCVLLINNKNNNRICIAKTVNISKGGVLICDTESLYNDEKRNLKLSDGDDCHLAIFIKHNLKIKSYAKYIRTEHINDSYRYAFQFFDMQQPYINELDKYITAEEFKLLQSVKNN